MLRWVLVRVQTEKRTILGVLVSSERVFIEMWRGDRVLQVLRFELRYTKRFALGVF